MGCVAGAEPAKDVPTDPVEERVFSAEMHHKVVAAPDLAKACANMKVGLETLTNMSLQSISALLPDGADADEILQEYFKELTNIAAQIQLDDNALNPKFNKTYGDGGKKWPGGDPIPSGTRGGIPYFCPKGWARFSLNVCSDDEFKSLFNGWGYLYHGTSSKHLGSILSSGFRASKVGSAPGVFMGLGDAALYMSPSIEYCGHPRYSTVEYNPETCMWYQMVLQCLVRPSVIGQKCAETMKCRAAGIVIDENISNDEMEWLIYSNYTDPKTGFKYVKDGIVCAGIMLRVLDRHPSEFPFWWSKNKIYAEAWSRGNPIVNPSQKMDDRSGWIFMKETEIEIFESYQGDTLKPGFKACSTRKNLGNSWLSPWPFARGGMRFAYYLYTQDGMYVVKSYNEETLRHIKEGLRIDESEAVRKEVHTYLVSKQEGENFNKRLPASLKKFSVRFLTPCIFRFKSAPKQWDHEIFGERYESGEFLKWNNNAGYVNMEEAAKKGQMSALAATFSHHTYHNSGGQLIVVDIQGWNKGNEVVFTDPQIHTRSQHRTDILMKRFSLGNLGKMGFVQFFHTHKCSNYCESCSRYAMR